MILKNYYEQILKRDLSNKFRYKSVKQIPRVNKIILNFGCKTGDLKLLSAIALTMELLVFNQGSLTKSKKINLTLKIRKGQPVGCTAILKNKKMYDFFTMLNLEAFPNIKELEVTSSKKKKLNVSFSLTFKQLSSFQTLEEHFYLFNKVPNLNISFIINRGSLKELLYLLKLSKTPIIIAIVTQLVECNLAKVKAKGSNPFIC